jgi:hypothetical protein
MFVTVLTRALHFARSVQSIPALYILLRSILILSTHLRLVLHSDVLPSSFLTKILYLLLLALMCATCPAHLVLLISYIHRIYIHNVCPAFEIQFGFIYVLFAFLS